jgi:hypothetical protein
MNTCKFDPATLMSFDELYDLVQRAKDRSPKAADACIRRFCRRHAVPVFGLGNGRYAPVAEVERAMRAEVETRPKKL